MCVCPNDDLQWIDFRYGHQERALVELRTCNVYGVPFDSQHFTFFRYIVQHLFSYKFIYVCKYISS